LASPSPAKGSGDTPFRSIQPKRRDVEAGFSGHQEVSLEFAYRTRELETVSRTWTRDENLFVRRMKIDQEIAV
jgi:hypothetical protein